MEIAIRYLPDGIYYSGSGRSVFVLRGIPDPPGPTRNLVGGSNTG